MVIQATLPTHGMRRQVRNLLLAPDWQQGLARLGGESPQPLARALLAALSSPEPETRHRAAVALGRMVAGLARDDMEPGREVMRRLVWWLNEESGSVIEGAPLGMAEIMANHAGLAEEFINILISYLNPDSACHLDFLPLTRAAAWGLGRVARAHPKLAEQRSAAKALMAGLESPDAQIRAFSAWGLVWLRGVGAESKLAALTNDQTAVDVWEGERLNPTTVGQLAARASDRA